MTEASERFYSTVQLKAGIAREDAERAARAVLETLAERIAAGEARDLAASLPPEPAAALNTTTPAEGFDVDEFVRRVAERTAVDPGTAERYARAVFAALGRTVPADEIRDMTAELPRDFAPLIAEAEGRFVEIVDAAELLRDVSQRAGLDPEGARRAVEAVLETLAERIAGGEVEDLISLLGVELHAPLRRGLEASGGEARPMSLDEFLRRVAEREGVTPAEARDHARAVFAALRDAIPDREFGDITVQLPPEYAAVEAYP
jgi:uncharacterized protein (DUF2267 family)